MGKWINDGIRETEKETLLNCEQMIVFILKKLNLRYQQFCQVETPQIFLDTYSLKYIDQNYFEVDGIHC